MSALQIPARSRLLMLATTASFAAVPPIADAATSATTAPRFVGTPSVRYAGRSGRHCCTASSTTEAPTVQRDLSLRSTGRPPFKAVYVQFVTTRKAARIRVSIDGKRGAVTKGWTRRVVAYSSKEQRPGHFKAGHRYPVEVTLCSSSGACSTSTRALKLQHVRPGVET